MSAIYSISVSQCPIDRGGESERRICRLTNSGNVFNIHIHIYGITRCIHEPTRTSSGMCDWDRWKMTEVKFLIDGMYHICKSVVIKIHFTGSIGYVWKSQGYIKIYSIVLLLACFGSAWTTSIHFTNWSLILRLCRRALRSNYLSVRNQGELANFVEDSPSIMRAIINLNWGVVTVSFKY